MDASLACTASPTGTQPLRAYTVATGQSGYFNALVQSCARHGVKLEVLGQGQKWKGFLWRLKLVDECLARLPRDELVLVTDGYDTIVLSDAAELRKSYTTACEDAARRKALDSAAENSDLEPMVLAPEHPRDWCSGVFSQIIVRSSYGLYGLPFGCTQPTSPSYVVNAGVILAPAASLRAYYAALFEESAKTGCEDDQWLLNRLYWSRRLRVPLAVDLQGSVAYCHANRDATSVIVSMFIDQNRHRIPHNRQLVLEEGGAISVRRSGTRVGVLHAITNADVDALCTHVSLPQPEERKTLSQVGVRFLLHFLRFCIYAIVSLFLWIIICPRINGWIVVPSLTLGGLTIHYLTTYGSVRCCTAHRVAKGGDLAQQNCERGEEKGSISTSVNV